MLEEASNLRRGGVTEDVEGLVVAVLRVGRSAKAETLLRRFSAIAESVVRNRLIIVIR